MSKIIPKTEAWRLVYNPRLLPLELTDKVAHLHELLEQRIADRAGIGINEYREPVGGQKQEWMKVAVALTVIDGVPHRFTIEKPFSWKETHPEPHWRKRKKR